MTLDEAIQHCEEVAEENEKFCYKKGGEGGYFNEDTDWNITKCAAEHRQLAEWLKELKDYRERTPFYEAGYNDAKREIALSGEYERAYERGKADAQPKTEVFDKIRAEVGALPKTYPFANHIDMYVKEDDVKKIIDKYKAKSGVDVCQIRNIN
jgi:hypothetical protein